MWPSPSASCVGDGTNAGSPERRCACAVQPASGAVTTFRDPFPAPTIRTEKGPDCAPGRPIGPQAIAAIASVTRTERLTRVLRGRFTGHARVSRDRTGDNVSLPKFSRESRLRGALDVATSVMDGDKSRIDARALPRR